MEWHIQDFPKELIVKLKEGYLREVVESIGGQRKTARLLKVAFPYLHQMIKGKKNISLKRLLQIISLSPEKEKFMKKLEENIIALKAPSSRAYWIKMKLPLKLTEELGRVIGRILGDGNVKAVKGKNVRYGTPDIVQLTSFIEDLEKVFGKVKFSQRKKKLKNCIFYEVEFPSVIGRILTHLFGPFGCYIGKIPSSIMNATKEVKREILKVLVEDESRTGDLVIGLVNKVLIYQIKKLLNEFGIRSKVRFQRSKKTNHSNVWILSVAGIENFQKFWKEIGFTKDTEKERKFEERLMRWKKYKLRGYHNARQILVSIRSGCSTFSKIVEKTKLSTSTVCKYLKILKNEKKIAKTANGWEINGQWERNNS